MTSPAHPVVERPLVSGRNARFPKLARLRGRMARSEGSSQSDSLSLMTFILQPSGKVHARSLNIHQTHSVMVGDLSHMGF